MTSSTRETLALTGLSLCASQVWGAVRLVPLLRDEPIEDLRLDRRCWNATTIVELPKNKLFTTFIPHAFVVSWSNDSSTSAPEAALGTQATNTGKDSDRFPLRFAHRMAKRERRGGVAQQRLRFLPLHTAFEGYLALHFAGPDVLRREYSDQVLSQGLSPRIEAVTPGHWIPGLEEALRVFEIREGQVGVLIFVADTLAAAFVVPHPDDYRQLHRTLLCDFYGELVYQYGCLYDQSAKLLRPLRGERVSSLADLQLELARARADWSAQFHEMARGLLEQPVSLRHVYRLGRHRMFRFLPEFRLREENHIGELIRAPGGELAYLKTFRLSEPQVRRGYLLDTLARHDWDLDAAAEAMRTTKPNLLTGLERAGFSLMLRVYLRKHSAPEP
jgi:hypothetical protein